MKNAIELNKLGNPKSAATISSKKEGLARWLIKFAENVAIPPSGLALLKRIETLGVPVFASTEEAVEWGSHLSAEQRATLVDLQRLARDAALAERDLQCMVYLATQSQLIREAAEAAPTECHIRDSLGD